MPEEQQGSAGEKTQAEAPFVLSEEELSEADISELLHMTSGRTSETTQASEGEQAGEEKQGDEGEATASDDAAGEGGKDAASAATKNVTLTQEQLTQMAQGVAAATVSAQQQQAPQTQQQPPPEDDVVSELMRQNPGLDEDAAKFMVNTMTPLLKRQLGGLEQRLAGLQQYIVQNSQKQAVEGLRSVLNREMDRMKVSDDGDEREDLFDLTVSRGLRNHGQAFDEAKAIQELRKLHNRRVKAGYTAKKATVATKKQAAENTPPVTHVSGNKTMGSDIYKALRDPRNKDMDIGSPGFNKILKGLVKTPAKAIEELLG